MELTAGNGNDKLLTALDTVLVKDGIDNFKEMRQFVRDFAWTEQLRESLVEMIDQVEIFLRSEFPQHLDEDSTTGHLGAARGEGAPSTARVPTALGDRPPPPTVEA